MFLHLSVIFYSQEIQTVSNAISYVDHDYKKAFLWKETTLFLKIEATKQIHLQIGDCDSSLVSFNA